VTWVAAKTGDIQAVIDALMWDIGGVLLTNGWGHESRNEAIRLFRLDPAEFTERHEEARVPFELGALALDAYLDRTVFYQPRDFSRAAFRDFMFGQSRVLHPEVRRLVEQLARAGQQQMVMLNNESRELNDYRIATFDLRRDFVAFVSSCYVGVRKPETSIYRLALDATQHDPGACVFIDDRPINLEPASALGMHAIHFQTAAQLVADLSVLGVTV